MSLMISQCILVKLIAANADVNKPRDNGITPLSVASELGHGKIVTTLLDANADVHRAENHHQFTPLYIACQKGQPKVVAMLLAAKASVDQATAQGVG